jgi:prepilin-type N-terminal cleavage/methylation domain-containing protein
MSASRRHNGGWTILEIMIVVSIIGLMALIAIPTWTAARTRSQREVCSNNQRLIHEQLNIYCLERNKPCTIDEFPNLCAVRDALVPLNGGAKYIKRRTVFACPGNQDQTVQHDYGFIRDGRQIIGFSCNIVAEHNAP